MYNSGNKLIKFTLIISSIIALPPVANAQSNQNTINTIQIPKAATTIWEADVRKKCASYGEKFKSSDFALISKGNNKNAISNTIEDGYNGYIVGDFNGDKKNDYIIMSPNSGCTYNGKLNFGDNGPPNHFIISNSTSYSVFDGFSAWLYPSQIKRAKNGTGRDVLEITDGGYYGKCGEIYKVTWGWDGQKIDLLDRHNKLGQKINSEGCVIQTISQNNKQTSPVTTTKNNVKEVEKKTEKASIKVADKVAVKPTIAITKRQVATNKNAAIKTIANTTSTTKYVNLTKPTLPPITQGYYAYHLSCSDAVAKSSKDKPSDFIGLFNDKYWAYYYENGTPWGNIKIEKVDDLGNNQYRLKLRSFGNGNDKKGNIRNTTLNILSATKFTLSESGHSNTYNYCPARSLPDWLKAHFEINN